MILEHRKVKKSEILLRIVSSGNITNESMARDLFDDDQLKAIEDSFSRLKICSQNILVWEAGNFWRIKSSGLSMMANIKLNKFDQIIDLSFFNILNKDQSIDKLLESLKYISEDFGFCLIKNGDISFNIKSDHKFQIASLFKLWIIKYIESNDYDLLNFIQIDEYDKSIESGLLHKFSKGSSITIDQAIFMMCVYSDNTAADILLNLFGKRNIALLNNLDILISTREWFIINNSEDLIKLWIESDLKERRNLLNSLSSSKQIDQFDQPPVIGWESTPESIAMLMRDINNQYLTFGYPPVVYDPSAFQKVYYKGGHAPGIFSFACKIITRNDTEFTLCGLINSIDNYNSRKHDDDVSLIIQKIKQLTLFLEDM